MPDAIRKARVLLRHHPDKAGEGQRLFGALRDAA